MNGANNLVVPIQENAWQAQSLMLGNKNFLSKDIKLNSCKTKSKSKGLTQKLHLLDIKSDKELLNSKQPSAK